MFDFGLFEFVLVALVALVVLGPQRLSALAVKLGRYYRVWRYQYQRLQAQWSKDLAQVDSTIEPSQKKDDVS